jgi:DNA-binding MarR family transcriptional regulator
MLGLLDDVDDLEVPGETEFAAWTHFVKSFKVLMESCDNQMRESVGLSLAEFEILYLLAACGGRVRFIDLSKVTLLSQSRVSRQIDTLKARGWVDRDITDSNRRATYAVLTAEGLKRANLGHREFIRLTKSSFFDRIPPGKLATFGDVLKGLMDDSTYFHDRSKLINAYRDALGKDEDEAQ